jgi:Rrf2 family iron-sulfur cluster assembly transcriptional regulator
MRLTTKGRYAVTAALDLALHNDVGQVKLADISRRQGISHAYLEHLLGKLKQAGLVVSVRGPGGGYRLSHALEDINVSDIINAVGEGLDATRCGGTSDCQHGEICLTHELWTDLSHQIDLFLSQITLASLVARRQDADNLIDARIL